MASFTSCCPFNCLPWGGEGGGIDIDYFRMVFSWLVSMLDGRAVTLPTGRKIISCVSIIVCFGNVRRLTKRTLLENLRVVLPN